MSRILRYLTHPQVRIDPNVAVPEWGLSEVGRKRAAMIAGADIWGDTRALFSSAEVKAVETASIISTAIGIEVTILPATHENDRSATGFLEPDEFERAADAFFAEPGRSVRGWERACDAQARISREVERVLSGAGTGDVLFVGHGGVGALLYCRLAGLEINRIHDQPAGGGNLFAFDLASRRIVHGWAPIEQFVR